MSTNTTNSRRFHHPVRRRRGSLWVRSLATLAAAGIGLVTVGEREARATDWVSIAETTYSVLQKLYSANDWINCHVYDNCPDTVQQQLQVILNQNNYLIVRAAWQHFIPDTQALLDLAVRVYQNGEPREDELIDTADSHLRNFGSTLSTIDPTSAAEVNEAYVLAPMFTVAAGIVDQVFRTAVDEGKAPQDQLDELRYVATSTEYALVGSQSLWYSCPGSSVPVMIQTVQNMQNEFPTKKLWQKFADQKFSLSWCQNDCDIFRRVTSPSTSMCKMDCPTYWGVTVCSLAGFGQGGCIGDTEPQIYQDGLHKALAQMTRDPVVGTLRNGMEHTVAAGGSPFIEESYCGLSWGQLLNPGFTDYQTWLSSPFAGTHGTLTGDVDGDGMADLVALNDYQVNVTHSNGGAFGPTEVLWNNPFYGSHGTFLGDVDGDGTADLVGLGDGYIGVVRSGVGAYETWSTSTFFGDHGTFLGDVSGDGKADLVALTDGNVSVMLSHGSGFNSPQVWWSAFYGEAGGLLGDVDGDGKADLVQLTTGGPVGVIRSTGNSFGAYETWNPWSGDVGELGAFLADVDGDGKADVVDVGVYAIQVNRSNGSGFNPSEGWWFNTFYDGTVNGLWAGDFDGNGKADLLSAGVSEMGVIRSR